MKKTLDELVDEYIGLCEEYARCYELPDDGSCGKMNRKATRVYCAIRKRGADGIDAMLKLMEHPDRFVRTGAAFHMAWYDTPRALKLIEEDYAVGDRYGLSHEPWIWGVKHYPMPGGEQDPWEQEQKRAADRKAKREMAVAARIAKTGENTKS